MCDLKVPRLESGDGGVHLGGGDGYRQDVWDVFQKIESQLLRGRKEK